MSYLLSRRFEDMVMDLDELANNMELVSEEEIIGSVSRSIHRILDRKKRPIDFP